MARQNPAREKSQFQKDYEVIDCQWPTVHPKTAYGAGCRCDRCYEWHKETYPKMHKRKSRST